MPSVGRHENVNCRTCEEVDTGCTICYSLEPRHSPKLCDNCQGWDDLTHITFCIGDQRPDISPNVFTSEVLERQHYEYPASAKVSNLRYRRFEELEVARECLVCRTIVAGVSQHDPRRRPESIAIWRIWPDKWHSPAIVKRQQEGKSRPWVGRALLTFCAIYPDPNEPRRPQTEPLLLEMSMTYSFWGHGLHDVAIWDRRFLNPQIIRNWLEECQASHTLCKKTESLAELPSGFRLIDVERRCVVEAPENFDGFIALSYQWSTATSDPQKDMMLSMANLEALKMPGSLPTGIIPEVIEDSIQLCSDMNEKYLWVDRLCITQDEEDPDGVKQAQIKAMDAVYGLATVTFVACSEVSGAGLPGATSRPRHFSLTNRSWSLSMDGPHCLAFSAPMYQDIVEGCSWNRRGWTFQEGWIPKRHLFFGDHHVFFKCDSFNFCESFTEEVENQHRLQSHFGLLTDDPRSDQLASYLSDVQEYTKRSLSHSSDVLNAFVGVSNILLANLQSDGLFGLPEMFIFRSLLWLRKGPPPPTLDGRVPQEIPSWSWASGTGPVEYGWWTGNHYTKVGNLVRFWYCEEGTIRELSEVTSWFDFFNETYRPGVGVDEERVKFMENSRRHLASNHWLSETSFWDSCPHSPWASIERRQIQEEQLTIALNIPGCLVFNTTESLLVIQPSSHADSTPESLIFDIIGKDGFPIGNAFPEYRHKQHKLVSCGQHSKFHVIVLGACSRGKDSGKDWEPSVICDGQEVYTIRGACGLYVMILERNGHLSSRIGMGVVSPVGWTRAKPRWRTIFLV